MLPRLVALDAVPASVAFVAGLVSFFSPCVVPVVPGYVAFLARGAAPGSGGTARRLLAVGCFVLGFGVAFVLIGAAVGALGATSAFRSSERWVERIGGALIIVFGLAMTGLLTIPLLLRDARYHGTEGPSKLGPVVGAAALGAAFGVGWSPCVGPVLASILLLAGATGGAGPGALLLAIYAAGLGIPFLVVGLAADRGAAIMRRFARATRVVEVVGGILLILLGIAVFTGSVARFTSYLV
jgi:cytochrome c-type biogenesis protein